MKHLLEGMGLIFLAAQSLLPLLPTAMPVIVRWSRASDRLSAAAGIRPTAHFTQATEQQPARGLCRLCAAAQPCKAGLHPISAPLSPAVPPGSEILKHLAQTCQVSFRWRKTGSFMSHFKAWGQTDPQCCSDRVRE